MAQRLRLFDLRLSRLPGVVGLCADDVTRIANIVNSAQQRLIFAKECGDEGWWGTWAEVAFSVDKDHPYLTTPRGIARLVGVTVCNNPVPIQNQFYEYLQFGNGRMPKTRCAPPWPMQLYSRNNVPTFVDLYNAPQYVRVYMTDPADDKKQVLLQGLDANGVPIYSIGVYGRIEGVFLPLTSPYVTSAMTLNQITGLQKDVTMGQVKIYQVDPTSGEEVLLLTMEPSETTAWYRRYFFNPLPNNCCGNTTTGPITVTALAKLDLIPVQTDTDYCLIQNVEAIIEECASVRYSEMDTPSAKQMAQERHQQAIRLLNGELAHRLGIDEPAVEFAPFGTARLECQRIGSLF